MLLVEGGGFYGTEWDDLGIVPEHFQEEGQEEAADTYAEEEEQTISEDLTQKEEVKNQEAVRSEAVQPEAVRSETVQENLETEKEEILPVLRKIPEPDDWGKKMRRKKRKSPWQESQRRILSLLRMEKS